MRFHFSWDSFEHHGLCSIWLNCHCIESQKWSHFWIKRATWFMSWKHARLAFHCHSNVSLRARQKGGYRQAVQFPKKWKNFVTKMKVDMCVTKSLILCGCRPKRSVRNERKFPRIQDNYDDGDFSSILLLIVLEGVAYKNWLISLPYERAMLSFLLHRAAS